LSVRPSSPSHCQSSDSSAHHPNSTSTKEHKTFAMQKERPFCQIIV